MGDHSGVQTYCCPFRSRAGTRCPCRYKGPASVACSSGWFGPALSSGSKTTPQSSIAVRYAKPSRIGDRPAPKQERPFGFACQRRTLIGRPFERLRRWPAGTIPAYLVAHHAKSQLWHASTLLFGFFLTEACGIGARAMGWIMATSLLLNALVDLGMGAWLRGIVTDEAAARRMQARGTTLTCGFFLLFCATPLLPPEARSVWALATLLGFRATYPLLDVPQNAIVALLPLSEHARFGRTRWPCQRGRFTDLIPSPLVPGPPLRKTAPVSYVNVGFDRHCTGTEPSYWGVSTADKESCALYWSPDLASAHWEGTRLMFDATTDTGVVRYSVAASQLRNVAQRTGAEALSTNLAHLRVALRRKAAAAGVVVSLE